MDRQKISIEEVLRRPSRARDIWTTFCSLLQTLPRPWVALPALIGLTLAEVSLQVGIALSGKRLLDESVSAAAGTPWGLAFLGLGLAIGLLALSRIRYGFQESVIARWRASAVARLSQNITGGRYEDLAAVPMAALREIVMTDAPYLTRFWIETFVQVAVLCFWILATLGLLLLVSPLLLAVFTGLLLLVAGMIAVAMKFHLQLTAIRFRALADLSQRARDVAEVERVVLARQFGLGDRFVQAFLTAHREFIRIVLVQMKLTASVRAALLGLGAFAFLSIVIMGARQAQGDQIEMGALLAALYVVAQTLAALNLLGDLAGRGAEASTAGRRLSAYWDARGPDPRRPLSTDRPIEGLRARQLGFGYGEAPSIFEDVSLELTKGKLVALTAATGAGKTTLCLLLSGLLEPRRGRIEVVGASGQTPTTIDEGRILYVGPKPILVEGTLRENLLGGDPAAPSVRRVFDVLESTGVSPDPDRILVTPGGTGLSTGQSQLVQLARAVSREPEVVIFDEATGSLDMETESKVQQLLLEWCRARVCLVISHRVCPWTDHADEHLRW
jgi:ATP-binding cassette subfamily B protein